MSGGHSAGISACAVSPDGSFFVSASRDNTLKMWDAKTGEETLTLSGHYREVWFCAVGRNGFVYSAGPSSAFNAVVKVWDADTGDEVGGWEVPDVGEIKSLALGPDTTYVVTLRSYGYIDLHHPLTGEKLGVIDAGSGGDTDACVVAPDGSSILVSCGRELRVIDPVAGTLVRTFPTGGKDAFAVMPDTASVFFIEEDKGWAIGEIASGTSRPLGDESWFSSCAVSPDGSLVAACCSTSTQSWNSITGGQRTVEAASIRVRRTDSGELMHDIDLNKEEATVCAFSPDGSLLFAAVPGALRIWDVESGEEIGSVPLEAEATCLAVHPSLPVAAVGDAVGGFHVLDLGGVELGPVVVTAEDRGSGPEVRCPACNGRLSTDAAQLGTEMDCPSCAARWRVNPFVLRVRTEPLRPAGSLEPSEEEQTRFTQALNRALFTSKSPEDLTALSEKLEQRSAKGRAGGVDASAMEALRATGQAAAPQLTPFKEQLMGMLVEELAEAGIDIDAFPEDGGGQLLAAVASSSVLALTGKTAHLLNEGQRAELMRVVTETEDPLEAVRFLHEALPDFGVLDAFRAELKVACPQEAAKLGKVSDKVVDTPVAPRQPTPEAPPQLPPLNEKVRAMMLEEAAEAGIDLDSYPPQMQRGILFAGALYSVKAVAATAQMFGFVPSEQSARLDELLAPDGDLMEAIRLLCEVQPEDEVLDGIRTNMKLVYPQAAEQAKKEMSSDAVSADESTPGPPRRQEGRQAPPARERRGLFRRRRK